MTVGLARRAILGHGDAMPLLSDRVGLDPERLRAIEVAIADHGTLERVIRWGLQSEPQRIVADIVTQDEYTHDVVIAWDDELFLVYDCT